LSTVNLFVHWLYSGDVPGLDEYDSWAASTQEADDTESEYDPLQLLCIKAYAFADRFCVSGFQKTVNIVVVTKEHESILMLENTLPVVNYAFAYIPAERPILQYLVDYFCTRWREHLDLPEEIDMQKSLPNAFTMRSMRRFSEMLRQPEKAKMSNNCYLEHASNAEKKKCKQKHMKYHEEREFGYFK
jgi:hypothetical protein